eukprot:193828-Rhodomonas_salina.1
MAMASATRCPDSCSALSLQDGVDKGTPLRWLDADAEFEFSLSSSLAFGDSPHSNDAPLAAFQVRTTLSP